MFLLWEESNIDTDCPEMLWHPWRYSKPDRMQPWAGCCGWELGGMISRGAHQPQLCWDSAGWSGCAAQICLLVQSTCCEGAVPNEMTEQTDPTGCPACVRLMDCIKYWSEAPSSAPATADTSGLDLSLLFVLVQPWTSALCINLQREMLNPTLKLSLQCNLRWMNEKCCVSVGFCCYLVRWKRVVLVWVFTGVVWGCSIPERNSHSPYSSLLFWLMLCDSLLKLSSDF